MCRETQDCMTHTRMCSSKPIKSITCWRDSSMRWWLSVLLSHIQMASRRQFANIFAMILLWKSACNLHAQKHLMIHAAHKLLHQLMMDVIAAAGKDWLDHYNDDIVGATASQITNLTIVYSTVYSGANQRKHQCSASLIFMRRIHRWPVNFPHKGPLARKMFSFHDDVIMFGGTCVLIITLSNYYILVNTIIIWGI